MTTIMTSAAASRRARVELPLLVPAVWSVDGTGLPVGVRGNAHTHAVNAGVPSVATVQTITSTKPAPPPRGARR